MREIAIDLTWVRHKKVGGTESCVRNLLDGLGELNTPGQRFVLLVSRDNEASFAHYAAFPCFRLVRCKVDSASQGKRVLWQNIQMGRLLRRMGIDTCMEPVYGKPFFGTAGIRFYTTIHDLQAIHYPEYFSRARVLWMKLSWRNAVRTSEKVIAISQYVKEDILAHYRIPEDRVVVIYDAVNVDVNDCRGPEALEQYGVKEKGYYYTVSSLFPHKNLKTVILALGILKKRGSAAFAPLVISGIGGHGREELQRLIAENDLSDDVIFTPFVDNTERNTLYKYCRVFLFPSIFEGFGMPPIEAMAFGAPVLTTRCTSLEEVTGGLCNYVEEPLKPEAWAERMERDLPAGQFAELNALLTHYEPKAIASSTVKLLGSGR